MKLRILSVNVGLPRPLGMQHGEPVLSGIAKRPVTDARVRVEATNIVGDGQADLRVHGGTDKAVYAYLQDHWGWWEGEHGLACRPATFGENLTLSGGDESAVAVGDRFRWGEALLEVSQPRAPCYKFAMHVKREDAPFLMTVSAHCGFYLRVVEPGEAPARDGHLLREKAGAGPTVREAFTAAMHRDVDREVRLRVRDAAALAPAWRAAVARLLA